MSRTALLIALVALTGCNRPRAASYFKAHPEDAGRVIADCTAGTHHGAECDNGKVAEAEIQSDARLQLYKKSF